MARAPELHWNEGDRWSVAVDLPTSRVVRQLLAVHNAVGGAHSCCFGYLLIMLISSWHARSCGILGILQVEYKFVVLAADGTHAAAWQSGNNSVLAVQAGEETLEVFDNW
jgi:hypothetical protein